MKLEKFMKLHNLEIEDVANICEVTTRLVYYWLEGRPMKNIYWRSLKEAVNG